MNIKWEKHYSQRTDGPATYPGFVLTEESVYRQRVDYKW
jgi:hypothetical protein